MADAAKLTVADLRKIVTDASELAKGARIVDEGGLSHLSRHEHKLFADARGSTLYTVLPRASANSLCSCRDRCERPPSSTTFAPFASSPASVTI